MINIMYCPFIIAIPWIVDIYKTPWSKYCLSSTENLNNIPKYFPKYIIACRFLYVLYFLYNIIISHVRVPTLSYSWRGWLTPPPPSSPSSLMHVFEIWTFFLNSVIILIKTPLKCPGYFNMGGGKVFGKCY